MPSPWLAYRALKLTTNVYIAKARCESQPAVRWAECSLIIGTGIEFKLLAWSSIAQSVCRRAFILLDIRFQRPWVRILHSAEEGNLSPFDSKIACLYQSIAINNNKHVYRQSQVRKPTGSWIWLLYHEKNNSVTSGQGVTFSCFLAIEHDNTYIFVAIHH